MKNNRRVSKYNNRRKRGKLEVVGGEEMDVWRTLRKSRRQQEMMAK